MCSGYMMRISLTWETSLDLSGSFLQNYGKSGNHQAHRKVSLKCLDQDGSQ